MRYVLLAGGLFVPATIVYLVISWLGTAPRVELLEGAQYDFGHVLETDVVRHAFRIRNAGRNPLELVRIRQGCGCTSASVSEKVVQPGQVAELNVTYRARSVSKREMIEVVVETNDPKRNFVEFLLTGFVRYRVFWYPETVSIYGNAGGADLVKTVTFRTTTEPSFEMSDVHVSSPLIHVDVNRHPNAYDMVLCVSPECPKGSRTEYVTATCKFNDITKVATIPVYIMLH